MRLPHIAKPVTAFLASFVIVTAGGTLYAAGVVTGVGVAKPDVAPIGQLFLGLGLLDALFGALVVRWVNRVEVPRVRPQTKTQTQGTATND